MDDPRGPRIPRAWLRQHAWVHAGTGAPEYQLRLAETARAEGLRVAVDPAQEIFYRWSSRPFRRLLSTAEILFGNAAEIDRAVRLAGVSDTGRLLEKVPLVVRTEGRRRRHGVFAHRAHSRTRRPPGARAIPGRSGRRLPRRFLRELPRRRAVASVPRSGGARGVPVDRGGAVAGPMEMHAFGRLVPALTARRRLLAAVRPIERTDRISIDTAFDRIAAASVRAAVPVPPFARASWDGYTVRSTETRSASARRPVALRVVGEVYAESAFDRRVRAGRGGRDRDRRRPPPRHRHGRHFRRGAAHRRRDPARSPGASRRSDRPTGGRYPARDAPRVARGASRAGGARGDRPRPASPRSGSMPALGWRSSRTAMSSWCPARRGRRARSLRATTPPWPRWSPAGGGVPRLHPPVRRRSSTHRSGAADGGRPVGPRARDRRELGRGARPPPADLPSPRRPPVPRRRGASGKADPRGPDGSHARHRPAGSPDLLPRQHALARAPGAAATRPAPGPGWTEEWAILGSDAIAPTPGDRDGRPARVPAWAGVLHVPGLLLDRQPPGHHGVRDPSSRPHMPRTGERIRVCRLEPPLGGAGPTSND